MEMLVICFIINVMVITILTIRIYNISLKIESYKRTREYELEQLNKRIDSHNHRIILLNDHINSLEQFKTQAIKAFETFK